MEAATLQLQYPSMRDDDGRMGEIVKSKRKRLHPFWKSSCFKRALAS